ncbi:MAG: F0F1 ATP synthase subunit A, partial [Rhodocyclaceae bacterium]|nr:F0F1 ATP synthase subunit A [Rhodocyclaceae bacterium]
MATAHAPTASEYVSHHLGHLTNVKQTSLVDWSVIHLDTMFYSIALGLLAVFVMARAAKKATSGVPGRFQAAVEIL